MSNYPPGVTNAPGDGPEDLKWDEYWESERPSEVWIKIYPAYPRFLDYYDLYNEGHFPEFSNGINADFETWPEPPEE